MLVAGDGMYTVSGAFPFPIQICCAVFEVLITLGPKFTWPAYAWDLMEYLAVILFTHLLRVTAAKRFVYQSLPTS